MSGDTLYTRQGPSWNTKTGLGNKIQRTQLVGVFHLHCKAGDIVTQAGFICVRHSTHGAKNKGENILIIVLTALS